MKVHVAIFPVAGLCVQRQDFEVFLDKGSVGEMETVLFDRLGVNPFKIDALMFLHNGQALDIDEAAVFHGGDQLWLLPRISGG